MAARFTIEVVDWEAGASTLRLEAGRASGSGGINRCMGTYELSEKSLELGPLATTMMAGPPDALESEQRFLAGLARVARWFVDGDQLILADDANVEILRLNRAGPEKGENDGADPYLLVRESTYDQEILLLTTRRGGTGWAARVQR